MTTAFVIGYDPGGNDAHGVAVLKVQKENSRWIPVTLQVTAARALGDAVAWLEKKCRDGRIVAAGIGSNDDCFDAGVALLTAFRGLNRDWSLDLHAGASDEKDGRVQFFGQTHYWWPPVANAAREN